MFKEEKDQKLMKYLKGSKRLKIKVVFKGWIGLREHLGGCPKNIDKSPSGLVKVICVGLSSVCKQEKNRSRKTSMKRCSAIKCKVHNKSSKQSKIM